MTLALLTLAAFAMVALLLSDRPALPLLAAVALLALLVLDAQRDARIPRSHPSRLVHPWGCR